MLDISDIDISKISDGWSDDEIKELDIEREALEKYQNREKKGADIALPKKHSSVIDYVRLIAEASPPDFLINNIIERGAMTVLAGQSGAFKSFIALDMAWSVAHNADFLGNKLFGAGSVLYVCGEGKGGVGRRLFALNKEKNYQYNKDLSVYKESLDLSCKKSVSLLRDTISVFKPDLVIFDTFSSLAGGINENDNSEVSAALKTINSITGDAATIIVHHFGKTKDSGIRGASAFSANCDSVIYVERDEDSMSGTITCGKSKDGEFFEDIRFVAEKVGLGMTRQDGLECTSLIIRPQVSVNTPRQKHMTAKECFDKAIEESGSCLSSKNPHNHCVTKSDIRSVMDDDENNKTSDGAKRQALFKFTNEAKAGKYDDIEVVYEGKTMLFMKK